MGVAAGMECLKNAGNPMPDAILTGTAYGCLEDTETFLNKIIQNKEEMLAPTAFIQSTHNTVGAQIALLLKCHSYNNTYVSRGSSFESALLDGMMLLEEKPDQNILVGGIDELTDSAFAILQRFGLYRKEPVSNYSLFESNKKGTVAGEGSCFFLLSNRHSATDLAEIVNAEHHYKINHPADIGEKLADFLRRSSVLETDIDLLITGKNGNAAEDQVYDQLSTGLLKEVPSMPFKQLCGEYPTAGAFALWLGASILSQKGIPTSLSGTVSKPLNQVKKILICNQYLQKHHSFLLLSAC
jgi:3-oxoacyl-(acyl-carrier-protein) synthase